jgi:hypothetical protein
MLAGNTGVTSRLKAAREELFIGCEFVDMVLHL